MIDEKSIRSHFPMIRSGITMQGKPLVWLDNASTTFKPDSVIEAVNRYYTSATSNSHRGDYDLCYDMDVEVLNTRKAVAKLINCDPNEVVFTAGTTASINQIAYGYAMKHLHVGDEILLSEAEHASNVLPWYKACEVTGAVVKMIPLDKEGLITPENLRKTISNKTKIVSLAHVSNVLGATNDVKALAKIAHEFDAIMVVDGAQSVPHMPIDVRDMDCDFLAFSGHKMCGPTGIGVLYGKGSLLEVTDPMLLGGGMNDKFGSSGSMTYLKAPFKFEAGTQNLEGILGLKAAVEFLLSIGLTNIRKHEIELKKYAVEKLKATGNAIIYNEHTEAGIVAFNIKGVFAQDAATFLNSRGIACRSGQHCAKILNGYLGTVATVRASFYFYTTKEDIDALADAVAHGKEFLDAYF